MKKLNLTAIKIFILILSLQPIFLCGVERIFSKYYYIQQGDNLIKIIKENIWFSKLKDDQKNKIIKYLKKWNPHIRNWNKLSSGQKIYLEFEQRFSKDLPILIGGKKPRPKMAIKEDDIIKPGFKIADTKRIPQSKIKSRAGQTLYKIMPYDIDISLGGKLYNYKDAITQTGTKLISTDLSFHLDFHLLYPLKENLKFYFNFGVDYTTDQECQKTEQSKSAGFCDKAYVYQVPLAFIMKSGLKRTIFSSSFKKGFNIYLGLEREELSYASASKNLGEAEVLTTDGGKYIRPTKSTLLWITSGIEYNFSIWNKQSALSLLGSYSVSGTSQTQDTSEKTSYWENIAGYKLYWDYKQYLTKSVWTNLYSHILNFDGKFSFTSFHSGMNIGYSF